MKRLRHKKHDRFYVEEHGAGSGRTFADIDEF